MSLVISKSELVDYDDIKMPNTLYKYRYWCDKFHKRMITNREVYFASPAQFEDKLDCKIPVRWDLLTYGEISDKYFQDTPLIHPEYTLDQRIEFAIRFANETKVTDKEYVKQKQLETFEKFNQREGVLSMTADPLALKMWEKYAKFHTGFCIGFDPKMMLKRIGTGGGEVIYYDVLPIIYPSPKQSFMEQSILQVFSKLREWEFEKEYRTYIFRKTALSNQQRAVVIPPEAFKEIILGASMTKEEELAIIASIPKELIHIKIKKAQLINDDIKTTDYLKN